MQLFFWQRSLTEQFPCLHLPEVFVELPYSLQRISTKTCIKDQQSCLSFVEMGSVGCSCNALTVQRSLQGLSL